MRYYCSYLLLLITAVILSDDSEGDITETIDKKQPYRIKRQCPLPGCESKAPYVKLANHIRNYHNITSAEERRKWLYKARKNVRLDIHS